LKASGPQERLARLFLSLEKNSSITKSRRAS
jgi:hypothetical protein